MANITIRNLDDEVKTRLRMRASGHSRSMEGGVRPIPHTAAGHEWCSQDVANIAPHFRTIGGVDLKLPPREPPRFGRERGKSLVCTAGLWQR